MMSFIRPRTGTRTSQARPAHEGDAIPFESLCERGLGDTTHRWLHYHFVADEAAADRAVALLAQAGWRMESVSAMPQPFPGWTVRVSRDVVLSVELLDEARTLHEHVASVVDGSYAGWDVVPAPRRARATNA